MIDDIQQILFSFLSQHRTAVLVVVWSVLSVGFLQNVIYILQLPVAWKVLRRHCFVADAELAWQTLVSDATMPVAVIVPAYNEASVIVESVRCFLSLQYPETEIIVVNDGSNDATLDVLIEAYSLEKRERAYDASLTHAPIKALYGSKKHPNLLVIDKEGGRNKADAVNAGINLSRFPLFCVVDSDSLLDGGALLRAVRPFIEDPLRMVAVGGTIRVVNGCVVREGRVQTERLPKKFLPLIQTMEYIRAFLMARTAFSQWGVLLIVSGAFGVFRRDVVLEVGGYSRNTVGEDMEIVVKIHRYMHDIGRGYAMRYVAEPVCWTQVPQTISALGAQRTRWQRGALETVARHLGMAFRPRYGKIGLLALPYSLLVDVVGPLAEVIGYFLMVLFYALNVLSLPYYLAFTGLVVFYGVFISVTSLLLEEEELWRAPRTRDLMALFFVAVIENFGYRQLNNIWRVVGFWRFLKGEKGWESSSRQPFFTPPPSSAP